MAQSQFEIGDVNKDVKGLSDQIGTLNSNIAKYKTKTVSGTTGNTGAISTSLSVDNYIMGHKMNDSTNLEIQGYIAYNGVWYIQTGSNNTSVDMTVIYRET